MPATLHDGSTCGRCLQFTEKTICMSRDVMRAFLFFRCCACNFLLLFCFN